MGLVEKLPTITDDALQTLATNAKRLVEGSGTPAQQSDARNLLPAIDAELASRRVAKLANLAKMRAEAPARKPAKPKKSSASRAAG